MNICEKMREIDPPQWMVDLFKAIDALDLSEDGGFSISPTVQK